MNKQYKIRITFIFLLYCCAYLIILLSLYTIQIKRRDFFMHLGNQQYSVTIKQHPPRGLIFDSKDNPLALNHETLSAFIMPHQLEKVELVEPFLKKYFPTALQRLQANPQASFMYIKRRLTDDELAFINNHNLTDIKLLKEPSRYYPNKAVGQIIGITDIDNVGLFGIEQIMNKILAGTPSTFGLEKDARSGHFYFKKETMVEGTAGEPVHLTLDNDLQFLAYQELKKTIQQFNAQEGSVLIINPTNGHILAMVNYPTFDPNNTLDIDLEKAKNKIIMEAYELGSVMKVFVALALLDEELVDPNELIDCENTKVGIVNGTRFSTVIAQDIIPFSQVIQSSNNIGIAKTALRLGPKLYDHYNKIGFGKKTTLHWPGQQAGFVNPPSNWSRSSPVTMSFGYEVRATLLQLAQAFCMIANDGFIVPLKIIQQEKNAVDLHPPLYSFSTLQKLKAMLKSVARDIEGYTITGKTGTANMVIDGHYDPNHNIYTFAGILQKDNYKRVIITFVKDAHKKGLYASTVAVPLFDRIVEDLLIHESMNNKEFYETST